jgi:hypothetical protein
MAQDERVETVGDWKLTTIVDPITDEGRMIASVEGGADMLAIKCDEPGAGSVYIHWIAGDYLGGDFDRRDVLIRFDQDPPRTERWAHEGRNSFQPDDRQAAVFARRLSTASRVVLRGSDYRGREHTAIFQLDPAVTAGVVGRVFETCRAGAY